MTLSIGAALLLLAPVLHQQQNEPVWYAAAPPFGAIAVLAGIPDLASVRPTTATKGPRMTDIRVADLPGWYSLPGRYLRLTQVGDTISATMFQWSVGSDRMMPPVDPSRRCTAPTEGPPVCIQSVGLPADMDWKPLMETLLKAQPCGSPRPADARELRLHAVHDPPSGFRQVDICGQLADEVWNQFDRLTGRP